MRKALLLAMLTVSAPLAAQVCLPEEPLECTELCDAIRTSFRSEESGRVRSGQCGAICDGQGGHLVDVNWWVDYGCDRDATEFHRADECAYALEWLRRWGDARPCSIFWPRCDYVKVICMMSHPWWDGCFCGHPGDGC